MTDIELIAKNHPTWHVPTVCPVCHSPLELNDKHTLLICPNDSCSTKLVARIDAWTDVHKIKELAPVTIEKFVKAGLISCVADLYNLDYGYISNMDGFKEKSAENIKKNIASVKSTTLEKFISGFNITSIGEKAAKKMIDGCKAKTLDDLFEKKEEDFITDGIGEITAKKFVAGLAALKDDMVKTTKYIKIEAPVKKQSTSSQNSKLSGLSFCFHGACNIGPRKECEALVESNGGKITGVTKSLSYLVTDDDLSSTSSKMVKAKQLGIKIITSEDFMALLDKEE
jgi:DNA ligase (NAD+)